MLVLVTTLVVNATQYTVARTYFTVNGISGTNFQQSFVKYDDTLTCTLVIGEKVKNPAVPLVLYVYSARKATDSTINIGIRYEVSSDGTNWSSVTLGTDSTTWTTTTVSTAGYKLTVVPIQDNYASAGKNGIIGNHPYQRVRIIGLSATNCNPKIKLAAVFQ
jgi:hypothetical protein